MFFDKVKSGVLQIQKIVNTLSEEELRGFVSTNFSTGRGHSCLLGHRPRAEFTTWDHMFSAKPIVWESRKEPTRSIGIAENHVFLRHEFRPKEREKNKSFLGWYWRQQGLGVESYLNGGSGLIIVCESSAFKIFLQ